MSDIIKARARYQGDTIDGDKRFGFVNNVFYDIKIVQRDTILVKQIDNDTKESVISLPSLRSFLTKFQVIRIYD